MKPKNTASRCALITRAALLVLALGISSCAAQTGTQDLALRWMAIERSLVRARLTSADTAPVIQELEQFHKLARSFLDSRSYLTYRSVAPPPGLGAPAGPEILELADLVLALRGTVQDGDWDKAAFVSSDISASIAYALVWGAAANQTIIRVYSQLLLIFAVVAVLAIFVMQLFFRMAARSQKREEEGSAFSQAVLVAQENERGLLYRELHDTVAQELRCLSLDIVKIGKTDEKAERQKLCAEAAALQSGIQRRVRGLCENLAPPDLDIMELPDALRRLCYNFSERADIECRVNIAKNINLNFLDRDKQLQFFRIVQEALTNVEKHSRAQLAIVILRAEADGGLSVSVSDNGEGFETQGITSGGTHLGLRSMRERAALLCGVLTINSGKGEGTMVHLSIPPPAAETKNNTEGAPHGSAIG